MSTHAIEVVQIGKVTPHPDPAVERMALTQVWGWQCCVGKNEFHEGDKAVYIPPDYTVPLRHPSFAFLQKPGGTKERERIRVKRLRGAWSQGLLIPLPAELKDVPVGADVMQALGIERYEPPESVSTGGTFDKGPSGLFSPKFDVESFQRFPDVFVEGEEVIITEKIHGASARYVWDKDATGECRQFAGSRTHWMKEDEKNCWWRAFRQCPAIGAACKANPGIVLYGEVFGQVQKLKYGAKSGQVFFAAFAALDKDRWLNRADIPCPWVPVLYQGPFSARKLLECAEGPSTWPGANHMREGAVVVPVVERTHPELGRVCLKAVSNAYLEKDA
ncbi:MAG: RNA ligase (ATP) [Planctomycetota bacterium]